MAKKCPKVQESVKKAGFHSIGATFAHTERVGVFRMQDLFLLNQLNHQSNRDKTDIKKCMIAKGFHDTWLFTYCVVKLFLQNTFLKESIKQYKKYLVSFKKSLHNL